MRSRPETLPPDLSPATLPPAPDAPAPDAPAPEAPAPEARRQRLPVSVLALSAGTFTFVTAQSLPIGLLPRIGADLGRTLAQAGFLVTSYAATALVLSVPLALLTRRLPRRLLLGGLLVVFAASALASALAPTFGSLVAARIVMAVTQALFWNVVAATAAAQVPAPLRGRAVAALFTGSSLAPVVGLPALTWLGQQAGWRAPFGVLTALGVVTCAVVVASLSAEAGTDAPADVGEAPDRRRYLVLLGVNVLGVSCQFLPFTYLAALLTDVAGLPERSLGPALLVLGVAGVLGAVVNATWFQGRPRASLLVPPAVLAGGNALLHLTGRSVVGSMAALSVMSLAGSVFAAALARRVLVVAPGSAVVASAGSAAVYSGGMALGSWLGGVIVAGQGAAGTALPALALGCCGFGLALCEPLLVRASQRPRPSGMLGE